MRAVRPFRALGLAFGLVATFFYATSGHAQSPAPSASSAKTPSANSISAILGANKSNEPEFLEPDQAFRLAAFADGPDRIRLQWVIQEGYYLYKNRVKVATSSGQAKLGAIALPTGKTKTDEYFGKQEVYHDDLIATVPVMRAGGAAIDVPIDVTYQGCADAGLCYPPITKNLKVSLPGGGSTAAGGAAGAPTPTATGSPTATTVASAPNALPATAPGAFVSEQDRLASLIRDGNIGAVLVTFFGIGLLLAFTPCVLPMIPILSGIIVGQGEKVTAGRGLSLAFSYVQGMALTYAAAGAAFVLIFRQAPQAFFQKPWIICLFALLFVALALAMFGAYTLQLPSALQTRLTGVSNKQKSGSYVGVFVMGALSALVVTACVAPALIAALSVIGQTGRIARGAGALYATGLGMGVPLLIVGASAGTLLPKVGPWMDTVKSLFGVLFLGVSIYLVTPLLPPAVTMLLWSALAVISGFWIFALKARDGGPAPAPVRAAGLLALVYGVMLLIGVASGASDPLQPLETLRARNSGNAATARPALAFQTIKSVSELDTQLAAASAAGKSVMLDFYADWCVSCKEMEKYTFPTDAVQAALANTVLLRADVTDNGADARELYHRFGILGPPTIAFYDLGGQEQRNFRVVGYMKAPEFAAVVARALGNAKPT